MKSKKSKQKVMRDKNVNTTVRSSYGGWGGILDLSEETDTWLSSEIGFYQKLFEFCLEINCFVNAWIDCDNSENEERCKEDFSQTCVFFDFFLFLKYL